MKIILRDGTFYDVDPMDINQWRQAYPRLNIPEQIQKMAMWADANPRKRKTRRGVRTFIVNWLNRSSDDAPKIVTVSAASHRKFEPEKPKVMTKEIGLAALAALKK